MNLFAYSSNNPIYWIDPYGLFKYYGNWGGPDHTGGFKKSWDQLSEKEKGLTLSPIDSQDACYMKHDRGYGNCRSKYSNSMYDSCRETSEGNCFNREDTALQNCLSNLSPDPSNWPIPPRNRKDYLSAKAHRKAAGVAFALQKGTRRGKWSRDRYNPNSEDYSNPIFEVPIKNVFETIDNIWE